MKLTPNQGSILLLTLAMSFLSATSLVMAAKPPVVTDGKWNLTGKKTIAYDRGNYFQQLPYGDQNETKSAEGCNNQTFSAAIGEGEKAALKLYLTGAFPTDVSSPFIVMGADGGAISGGLLHADPGSYIFASDEVGGDGFHLVSGNYSLSVSEDDETSLIQPSAPDLSKRERLALLLLLLEMAGR